MAEKPHMNLVTVGHVDHGKSTLVGRLLFDTGNVPEQEMRKIEEKAKELKKESFKFAFLMDTVKEERERGLTIDLMHKRFDTKKFYFTLIDAPGHRDFVKNMITGASQADAAILVCSAKEGVQEQTKEHVFLIKTLGVNQVIVAINKMDAVKYDEAAYKKTVDELSKILKNIGYKVEEMQFIPTSAWEGDNIAKKSDKMAWYKGSTLLEVLDTLKMPEQPINKPLRLAVQDIYTITGVGTVPVGRVESGVLKAGDKLIFMPSDKTAEVKSIEMHHEEVKEANPGDNIGFNLRGMGKGDISRGDVAGHTNNPPTVVEEFTAQIIVLQHPSVITKGYTPVFHCHTASVACQFIEIVKTIDPATGATKKEKPDFIKPGDAAIVKIKPTKPLVLEKNEDFPQLARFAIRDMGQTIAAGMCIDLVKAKIKAKK